MSHWPGAFRRLLFWPLFALAAGVALAAPTVGAQSWPNQDVKIVHPFSSGGASDFTARLVAQRLSEIFGHPFIVENRPGAAGTIAAAEVARAAADGHTLLWATTSPIVIAPMLRNQQYDPKTDLLPISAVTTQAFGLTVHPSVPARTVADFVTHVRAHPGSFSYADSGFGTASQLSMNLFLQLNGLQMKEISFSGNRAALNEVLAGTVPSMFSILAHTLPHARNGRLRVLAVTSGGRIPQLPGAPTMQEAGFPALRISTWNGLMAPSGTPSRIVDQLAAAIASIAKDPVFAESLSNYAMTPLGNSPNEFAEMISADLALWKRVAGQSGHKTEQ